MAVSDIELLDRILLKFGLCDDDQQFEKELKKFLSPVLVKITDPNENVRKKVMECLTHVNKRLKSRSAIKINLEPIVKNYDESNNSFLINFAIIYITIGFPRLSTLEQIKLVPQFLNSLENKPEIHQNKIILLLVPLLAMDDEEIKKLTFDKPIAKKMLLSILLDILLLPYGHIAESDVPPGMSHYSINRITLCDKSSEYLENLKKGIVRFLANGCFDDMEVFVHLIVASADTRFSVATDGLNGLNKITPGLDWTDSKVSDPIYSLFSGNGSKLPDRKTSPCSPRLKSKILQYVVKFRGNALNIAKGLQVIFEGLFGSATNQKCKVASLQFASTLIVHSEKQVISKLTKVLQTYITKLIAVDSSEALEVQNSAYQVISKLITKCPENFEGDIELTVDFFHRLNNCPSDFHDSIKACLLGLAQAFKWIPNKEAMDVDGDEEKYKFSNDFNPTSSHLLILGILQDQCESKSSLAQSVASIFLTTCFPSYYVPSRYLLLIISGNCLQLKDAINGYLYGSQKKDHIEYSNLISCDHIEETGADEKSLISENKIILPSFATVISHFDQIAEKKFANAQINLDIFTEILYYTRMCFWFSAGYKCKPGSETNIQLLSDYVSMLEKNGNFVYIEKYMTLIRKILQNKKSFTELSIQALLELFSSSPLTITKNNLDLNSMISNSLKEINESIRKKIAKTYGIHLAYSCKDLDTFNSEISQLLNMSQRTLEHQHGSLLAVSNAIFYRIIFYKQNKADTELSTLLNSSNLSNVVNTYVKLLSEQKTLLLSAAIASLSLLGCHIKLPFAEFSKESDGGLSMEVDDNFSKNYVLTTIVQLLKSTQTKQKIREESATCLGYLSIGDHEFFSKRTIVSFLDLKRLSKDAALHIAIAQGLSLIVSGDKNLPNEITQNKNDDELLDWLVVELVKIVPEINVCSRQAISIWLLAIVQSCSVRAPILNRRKTLQMAFTHLLSEDNELVQDVASRGLGLVYNLCGKDEQSQLANLLLEQLTDGNKGMTKKVSDDTVLFEEGILGKTPTGQNITTYKELCSIASDLNNPQMIYSFMQLANHNASWNSRLGAAFGLQSISVVAKEKLQPYLAKIVPRLYRYKYDPTPKIQNSMIMIWDSIIINNKETIEQYYWDILNDVSKNLTHPEWRTRIACCLAIRDLLRQPNGLRIKLIEDKKFTKENIGDESVVEVELKNLWLQLFRVMDDVHEGTREAAEGTAKLLSKLSASAVSCDHGKNESFIVSNTILPILLGIGCTNTLAEIRALSLKTISEIIDSSGNLIQPHLPILIPSLLKATGEIEQTKLSMLSTMMSGQSESQEMVDSMRAELAKNHYTIKTLTKCVKFIDFDTVEKATPAVIELIKTSVNLGTKIACAHYISLIICSGSINKEEMSKLTGKYISASLHGLSDRNFIIRKHFANAIGDLTATAKPSTIASLFKKFNKLYFDDQAGNSKSIAQALNAINTKHGDMLRDNAGSILPLMLFAKHEKASEENKSTENIWTELWNDVNFGDSLLQACMSDIFILIEESLNHQSWPLKAQSGRCIEHIGKRLGVELKAENRNHLLELLLTSTNGRTFDGKEHLVEALSSLCIADGTQNEKIINAVLRECKKEEKTYKTKVLRCLGSILEKLEKENRFDDVFEIVWTLLEQSINVKEEDASHEERNKEKIAMINLKEAACECLGKAWPSIKAVNSIETQKKYQIEIITKLTECFKLNTRSIQLALLISLRKFIVKSYLLDVASAATNDENLRKICELVMANVSEISVIPHMGLKKEALEAFLILIKKLKTNNKTIEMETLKIEFMKIVENFKKDTSPEIKLRLVDINDVLK